MSKIFIHKPNIVNESKVYVANLLIEDDRICEIGGEVPCGDVHVIDGSGKYLLPGIIDAHVHFREPGLTHKADIRSESAAAVAGGVTSFLDMPNTIPNAIKVKDLENKFRCASANSYANYSFYIGATAQNITEVLAADYGRICAITDDGLYFTNQHSLLVEQPQLFRKLLMESRQIIAIHSEYESVVNQNIAKALDEYGGVIDIRQHPLIRSEFACVNATENAVKIARQTKGRLHVLHVSTGKEMELFDAGIPLVKKRITAEACVHHLWFSDEDYSKLGARIKWNPAIKTASDRSALLEAVNDGRIDIISTDHAPHLAEEKQKDYINCPSGAPMIQHGLIVMLELVKMGKLSIETIVEKMCHNPAILFGIPKRGFIRPGYYADLVLVDLNEPWTVNSANILYKCRWSPLEGMVFSTKVYCTIVNGHMVYFKNKVQGVPKGVELKFDITNNL